jgi:hypothetical protein
VPSKKYYFNEFADSLIRERYDRRTESISNLSVALGFPRWAIKKRAQMLGLAKAKEKPWSDNEVTYLEAHFPRLAIHTLARKLNRSTTAIAVKAKRLGIRKSGDGYTARSLAQALGVDDHKITRWVELGLMKANHRHTERKADMYLITDSAVKEFIVAYPTELDLRRADTVWLVDVLANIH